MLTFFLQTLAVSFSEALFFSVSTHVEFDVKSEKKISKIVHCTAS